MVILCLNGIYLLLKIQDFSNINSDLKLYSLLMLGFYTSIGVSIVGSSNLLRGFHELGSNIHFLLAPFVAYAIYHQDLWSRLRTVIKFSIFIGFMLAIYQYYFLDIVRAKGGATTPIFFGTILVLFAYILIIDIFKQDYKEKILSIILFCCAIFAMTLSQSRVALLEFLVLSIVTLFIWGITKQLNLKRILTSVGGILLITTLTLTSNIAQKRISDAIDQINSFSQTRESTKPVNMRLAMWESGFEAFKKNPFLGYGIQNTNLVAGKYVKDINSLKELTRHQSLHNDYINTLVGMGLLGFSAFLALLFIPLIVFFKRLKCRENFAKNATGILLITSSLAIATTDSIYTNSVMRTFFVFMLAVTFIRSKAQTN